MVNAGKYSSPMDPMGGFSVMGWVFFFPYFHFPSLSHVALASFTNVGLAAHSTSQCIIIFLKWWLSKVICRETLQFHWVFHSKNL